MKLKHPIMNASGVLGAEPEHIDKLVEAGFSAIVTKTFTLEERPGYPPPILVDLGEIGFLNAVGLANPGSKGLSRVIERAKYRGVPIVISIGGGDVNEIIKLAAASEELGASAIELNLSCPHVEKHGLEIGRDPRLVYNIVKDTVSVVKIPIFAKLGLCDLVLESAGKALDGGAKALTLINTVKAMAIDVYALRPVLSNKYGGLSGPAIKPIAIRVVYDIYKEYKANIIGCGGIKTWRDVAEFILAGARAVQIGSGYLKDHSIVSKLIVGLHQWLILHGFQTVEEAVGKAHS
ncbi:MAG: dihydroorotate dehydrogenase PyrD [Desulfurococcaceae archaeon]